MNVLVDTSVWSLAIRRAASRLGLAEKTIVHELSELINETRVKIIGLVRQELLSGVRSVEQFRRLREILRAFPDEPLSTDDFENAAEFSNQCRSRGLSVSVSDMLICSVSKSRGWAIFSTDPDFARYATILQLDLQTPRR